MNRWGTLIRREFWENRSLWIAPSIASLFLICSTVLLAVRMDDMQVGPRGMFRGNMSMGAPPGTSPFEITVFVFSSMIFGIGAIATAMYCLDSLYSERRDRSILFWKSLPVSDTQTVLAKAGVALVAMPVLLTVMALATNLLTGIILSINPPPGSPVRIMWEDWNVVRAYFRLICVVLVNVAWYAPAVAYAMVASVLSTRLPLVMAAVPLVTVAVGEQVVFGTAHVWGFLARRVTTVYNVDQVIASAHLWGGLLVAAAGFALAIRLRRWRDDS
jgi:ABC-2 type transport system permease protein